MVNVHLKKNFQDLKDRYEFIGGLSPLAGTTDDQADALVSALNKHMQMLNLNYT